MAKAQLIQKKLAVKRSKTHGYGVFAEQRIKAGEIIEECYFLYAKSSHKAFEDFYFDADGKYALLLGFGGIYNHSLEPNADYVIHVKKRLATFKAERNIQKGEEILVSYGDNWFSDRGISVKTTKKTKSK